MTDNIRAMLLAMGYRPYTLAADLDVSWDVAKRILRGKNQLSCGDILLLSEKMDISLNFLFDRPGDIAERRKMMTAKRAKAETATFKPYDFIYTLGGHKLLEAGVNKDHLHSARALYNSYIEVNAGQLSKDEIEAEALRIAQSYLHAEISA